MRWVVYRKTVKNKSTHYGIQAIIENVPADGFREIFIRGKRTRDRLGTAWPKQPEQEGQPWFWVPPELLERMRKLLVREKVFPPKDWGDYVRTPWDYASNYIRLMAEEMDRKGNVRKLDWNDP